MAKKKTAAKARPAGRKKPAAKAGKKAARSASPKKKKADAKAAKKVKPSPRRSTSVRKQVAQKRAKVNVVPKAKSKPAKVTKKVNKPVAKKSVVTKTQPKPVPASKIAVKPRSKNGAPTEPVVSAKAAPVKPVKAAPVATKPAPVGRPAPKAAHDKEAATVTAPRPMPRQAPPPPLPVVMKKALKEKVVIEFMVNSSPAVLYEMISSPSGFAEWYCTDVNVRGDQYTFIWPDEQESTTLIGRKIGEVIRFHRNDDDDEGSYFEFRVRIDAMTNEVALIVTDHAWPAEVEETRNLWNSQIHSLLRVLGA